MSPDEIAAFSVVGLLVGISSGYAQFLEDRIHGGLALFIACAVATVITGGLIILVNRFKQVPPRILLISLVSAVIGGLVGYAIRGDPDNENHRSISASASATSPASPSPGSGPTSGPVSPSDPGPPASPTPSAVASSAPGPAAAPSPSRVTPAPTTTPRPAGTRACISFSAPAADAAPIEPGTDVRLAGRVSCLAPGHEAWLLSVTSAPNSAYYIAKGDAVARVDGAWEATAFKLGDASDRGRTRTFFGVDADAACAAALRTASATTPRKVPSLPSGCRRLEPPVVVSFRS